MSNEQLKSSLDNKNTEDIFSNIVRIVPVDREDEVACKFQEIYRLYSINFTLSAVEDQDKKSLKLQKRAIYKELTNLAFPFLSWIEVNKGAECIEIRIMADKCSSGQDLERALEEKISEELNKENTRNLERIAVQEITYGKIINILKNWNYQSKDYMDFCQLLMSSLSECKQCVNAYKNILGVMNISDKDKKKLRVEKDKDFLYASVTDLYTDKIESCPDGVFYGVLTLKKSDCRLGMYIDLRLENYVRCDLRKFVNFHSGMYKSYDELEKFKLKNSFMTSAGSGLPLKNSENKLYIQRQFAGCKRELPYFDAKLDKSTGMYNRSGKYNIIENFLNDFNLRFRDMFQIESVCFKARRFESDAAATEDTDKGRLKILREEELAKELWKQDLTEQCVLNTIVIDESDSDLVKWRTCIVQDLQSGEAKKSGYRNARFKKIVASSEVIDDEDVLNLVLIRDKNYYLENGMMDLHQVYPENVLVKHAIYDTFDRSYKTLKQDEEKNLTEFEINRIVDKKVKDGTIHYSFSNGVTDKIVSSLNALFMQRDLRMGKIQTSDWSEIGQKLKFTVVDGMESEYKNGDWIEGKEPYVASITIDENGDILEIQFEEFYSFDDESVDWDDLYNSVFHHRKGILYRIDTEDGYILIEKKEHIFVLADLNKFGSYLQEVEEDYRAAESETEKRKVPQIRSKKYPWHRHLSGIYCWESDFKPFDTYFYYYVGNPELIRTNSTEIKYSWWSVGPKLTKEPNIYPCRCVMKKLDDVFDAEKLVLQLCNVRFVRTNQNTVIPFPFKYLKVWMDKRLLNEQIL